MTTAKFEARTPRRDEGDPEVPWGVSIARKRTGAQRNGPQPLSPRSDLPPRTDPAAFRVPSGPGWTLRLADASRSSATARISARTRRARDHRDQRPSSPHRPLPGSGRPRDLRRILGFRVGRVPRCRFVLWRRRLRRGPTVFVAPRTTRGTGPPGAGPGRRQRRSMTDVRDGDPLWKDVRDRRTSVAEVSSVHRCSDRSHGVCT
jgi:hypothetical protein